MLYACVIVCLCGVDVCSCAYALLHKDFLAVFLNSCFHPKLVDVKFYKHYFIFNLTAADMDLYFKAIICICMSLSM